MQVLSKIGNFSSNVMLYLQKDKDMDAGMKSDFGVLHTNPFCKLSYPSYLFDRHIPDFEFGT